MKALYKHTQMAWAIVIPVDIAALICLYLALAKGIIPAAILFFFLIILTYLFYSLTVIGTEQTLELRFGIGIVRKKFKLGEIMTAEPHRTHWWNGWGVRPTSAGLLFNVSGYDAVKLTLTNGKRYIIGTDEPDRLLRFIQSHH